MKLKNFWTLPYVDGTSETFSNSCGWLRKDWKLFCPEIAKNVTFIINNEYANLDTKFTEKMIGLEINRNFSLSHLYIKWLRVLILLCSTKTIVLFSSFGISFLSCKPVLYVCYQIIAESLVSSQTFKLGLNSCIIHLHNKEPSSAHPTLSKTLRGYKFFRFCRSSCLSFRKGSLVNI